MLYGFVRSGGGRGGPAAVPVYPDEVPEGSQLGGERGPVVGETVAESPEYLERVKWRFVVIPRM